MARQGAEAADGAGAQARLDGLIRRLTAELSDASTLDEMERRAKTISAVVKAQQGLGELDRLRQGSKGEDEQMDAAEEQALRDDLLARLDGFVAGLEQKGAGRCPACGRVEPDRDGLERVVARIAETA